MLDAIEPEPDLEPNLGSITSCGSYDSQDGWARGSNDDRERTGYTAETEDEEYSLGWSFNVDQTSIPPSHEDAEPEFGWTETEAKYNRYSDWAAAEPSLGWTESEARFGRYTSDSCSDLEDEHDGREPSEDAEPAMGWQNVGDQSCLHGQVTDGENEPSLGWADMEARYGRYGDDSTRDLEEQCDDEGAEHDGREPDVDDEVQSWTNPMAENLVGYPEVQS